jgi:Zn finger protein HypA/HybF involved in hydrogenase expression
LSIDGKRGVEMKKLEQAIAYFEDAIRESDEIIAEYSGEEYIGELQKELTEQKGHFEVALEAMRKHVPIKAKPLKKIPGISKCPVCKVDLCTEDGKTQIYCPDCGQAMFV